MTDATANPWLPAPVVPPTAVVDEAERAPQPPRGALAPQGAVPAPPAETQLGVWVPGHSATVWVVGAHGGSGETTLASLLGGIATAHRWPSIPDERPPVLLVARTHPAGLEAARLAMQAWAAAATPPVRLLGLVLIADAPGKLPKPWRQQIDVLAGGVPRIWQLPWSTALRAGDLEAAPKGVEALRAEVGAALLRED